MRKLIIALLDFQELRNKSPFSSNLQFEIDYDSCVLSKTGVPLPKGENNNGVYHWHFTENIIMTEYQNKVCLILS